MNRNTDLAIGPAFEIGDRKTFKEWVGPVLSLGTACCAAASASANADKIATAPAPPAKCVKKRPGLKGSPASSESRRFAR